MVILNSVLMVLDSWLTLVVSDSLITLWFDYSFVVSIIIARIIVVVLNWDMLDPVLLTDCRFTVIVLLYVMWIPLTSILLLIRRVLIDVSVFHHGRLKIMSDRLIINLFCWMQV